MPTPLAYQGILYVLGNNGLFDAYDLQTGEEIYRQRLPVVGSGFSASPVAADGKIYLSNEDGEILVIAGGPHVQAPGDQLDGRAPDGDAGAVERHDVRPLVDAASRPSVANSATFSGPPEEPSGELIGSNRRTLRDAADGVHFTMKLTCAVRPRGVADDGDV